MSDRAFFVDVGKYNVDRMLEEWRWLVTPDQTPLFVSVLADWVFGAPDGSLWALSTLEGDYRQVAVDAAEYNRQKRSVEWLEANFAAGWQPIAAGNGLLPNENECLGWKLHPVLGGAFEVSNQEVFDMELYQSIVGQIHRRLRQPPAQAPKKSFLRFWR